MNDDLPTDFDLIVVGTGLSESIIAAAASRIGKKVLHVDSNDYYGDLWASFNLDGLHKFIGRYNTTADSAPLDSFALGENETLKECNDSISMLRDIEQTWYIPEESSSICEDLQECRLTQTETNKPTAAGDNQEICHDDAATQECILDDPAQETQWTQAKILKEYRKFNIDLTPKLLYSRGALVELLISSNIARYAEFRNVSRVLTWLNETLQEVPCSRADVFATKEVSIIEKRMLMKLLTDVMNDGKHWDSWHGMKFHEFLNSYRLSSNILFYVLYTMAASTKETAFFVGLQRLQKFLRSLGRYGNTPFLWTMYGSGELPQCFCRLCAVFGGTYCLNRPIKALVLENDNLCKGICIGKQKINASCFVVSTSKAPNDYLPDCKNNNVSHGIFLISSSIKQADKENLTYIRFPPLSGQYPCTVIEVGPAASACPNDFYLLHVYKIQEKSPKDDLAPYVDRLLNTEIIDSSASQTTQTNCAESAMITKVLPQALWSFYYTMPDFSTIDLTKNVPSNVHLCAGPDHDIDFEFAVQQAKGIFTKIYPTEEFLPRAPDPEEIVLESDAETADETLGNNEGVIGGVVDQEDIDIANEVVKAEEAIEI